MKRSGLIVVAVLLIACLASEYLSHRRLNPTGHVSDLRDYLAWRPSAEQFAIVDVNGKPHVIAYGPRSSWLLLSSGPSAYVFDNSGRLIDWSVDIGDDGAFDRTWNAQRSLHPAHAAPRSEVESFAATPLAG